SEGGYYGRASAAGNIYTVAGNGLRGSSGDGGPATGAELNIPYGLAVDGAGNLVIADYGGNRVRVVAAGPGEFYGTAMAAGHIYTVAGHGVVGFDGDGGPAGRGALPRPYSVAGGRAGQPRIGDKVERPGQ